MGNIEKFDFIANQYDSGERLEIAKTIVDTIRCYALQGKEKTEERCALDYGCGTGLIGMQLLDDFESMVLVDASGNMVDVVNQKIIKSNTKKAIAICSDFIAQYPENLHADYIFMVQVLIHIKEVELILSRLYEILNPNGHLIIVDFDKNNAVQSSELNNGFIQHELRSALEKIGFRNINSKTFFSGEKIFMNCDASLFILDAQKPKESKIFK